MIDHISYCGDDYNMVKNNFGYKKGPNQHR